MVVQWSYQVLKAQGASQFDALVGFILFVFLDEILDSAKSLNSRPHCARGLRCSGSLFCFRSDFFAFFFRWKKNPWVGSKDGPKESSRAIVLLGFQSQEKIILKRIRRTFILSVKLNP